MDVVAPRCERPEHPMATATVVELRAHAEELGLLGTGEDAALGVWENVHDASARRMSLHTLTAVAEVNAGLAFHLHGLALGRMVARACGLGLEPRTAVALLGVWGFGRSALPRLLRGLGLDAEERALLSDYFACAEPRELHVFSGDDFERVLVPAFDAAQERLSFTAHSRDTLAPTLLDAGHGLDETRAFRFVREPHGAMAERPAQTPDQARELYADALCVHALGLAAIGVGALSLAVKKARDYAATRVQGGARIERHAAVQELLGEASAVLAYGHTTLDALAAHAPGTASLCAVLAARSELHPRLCAAANAALQVFGGIGYMRDTGLEKLVRDENTLRVLCGTPSELRRFVAEWERA